MKYNTFKYGTTDDGGGEIPYGASPAGAGVNNLLWIVTVDWDGNGILDDENEAIHMINMEIDRGRSDYLKLGSMGEATGFEPVQIGKATLTFDNTDGRYDPYNTASPLYPNVRPGRFIKIQVRHNTRTIHTLYAGKISNIKCQRNGQKATAIIECLDGMSLLKKSTVNIPISQDITIHAAIDAILDNINYPTIWDRDIETAPDVLSYWWANRLAATEIEDLASAELGTFFVGRSGTATYFSRGHANEPTTTITSDKIAKEINQPMPWEVVRNKIKIVSNPRINSGNVVLWTLQDTPLIAAGDTMTLWATYQYSGEAVPAISVAIDGGDFTANTASDGSGTDKTADFTTTLTDFGETAKIVIVNNAVVDAYVTLLQVHGEAIYSPDPVFSVAEDTASQALYDTLLFELDSRWLQSSTRAENFSTWLISFLATPRNFISVRFENQEDYQYLFDLFYTIHMEIAGMNIDTNFRITKINHKWNNENGQSVITTMHLEPFPDNSSYWRFPAEMGVTTIFAL